jgi:hypothetical protein
VSTAEKIKDMPAPIRRLQRLSSVVMLALIYATVVMLAADRLLRKAVIEGSATSPVTSPEVYLTILRVFVLLGAIALVVFQAGVYGVLFAAVTRVPRPRLGHSVGWTLWGQVPFMAAAGVAFGGWGQPGLDALQQPMARLTLGVVGTIGYAVCAWCDNPGVARGRVLGFVFLAVCVNSALLLLTATP